MRVCALAAHFHVVALLFTYLARRCVSTSASAPLTELDLSLRAPRSAGVSHPYGFPNVVSVHELPAHRSVVTRILDTVRASAMTSDEVRVSERFHVVDLLGGITRVGEYYTQIFVGGQAIRVQVDTGSSTLALPMAECTNCLRNDLRYDMRRSSRRARWVSCTNTRCRPDMCSAHKCTHCSASDACCAVHNPSACGFSLRYGDHSYARGALVIDEMTWGRNLTAPIVFGGILDASPTFERAFVDGILGMAYRALACNPTCVEPPFQQLVAAGAVADTFSICMSGSGGRLVLGGIDPSLAKGRVEYAPLALSEVPSYYAVNVSSELRIGSRSLTLPFFRTAIVDSGTTLLVVRAVVFELIFEHMKRHYCHVRGLCHTHTWFRPAACAPLTDYDVSRLPSLRFTVKPGVVLELRAQDYMIRYHKHGRSLRCVGIMSMPHLSRGTDAIFGNTLMQRYLTHYDRVNKRMGFAIAKPGCGKTPDCAYLSTCSECAAQNGCSYNFALGVCSKGAAGIGLVPYPRCAGTSCVCALGAQSGLLFGLVGGFVGTFILFAIAVLLMALYGRRDSVDDEHTLADGEVDVALVEASEDRKRSGNTTLIVT